MARLLEAAPGLEVQKPRSASPTARACASARVANLKVSDIDSPTHDASGRGRAKGSGIAMLMLSPQLLELLRVLVVGGAAASGPGCFQARNPVRSDVGSPSSDTHRSCGGAGDGNHHSKRVAAIHFAA